MKTLAYVDSIPNFKKAHSMLVLRSNKAGDWLSKVSRRRGMQEKHYVVTSDVDQQVFKQLLPLK